MRGESALALLLLSACCMVSWHPPAKMPRPEQARLLPYTLVKGSLAQANNVTANAYMIYPTEAFDANQDGLWVELEAYRATPCFDR